MVTVELPLDIPDIAVKQTIPGEDEIIIEVESIVKGAVCRKCGQPVSKPFNKGREIEVRHSSVFGRPVNIRIAPPRYECTNCTEFTTTTQTASWYTQRSPLTIPYENQIPVSLINSTVKDTALKEGIGYEAVMGVLKRRVSAETDWKTIGRIDFIGLDEVSLKKGHKDFVTVVSALSGDELTVPAVLEGREKKTVKQFLKTVPKKIKKKLKGVCSDMYDGYINAAKEALGKNIKIIADRFHVVKLYKKGVENLRKKEMKRLQKELPEEEYKKLKGVMRVLRKKSGKLNDEQKETLEILFKHSSVLKQAYDLCNDLSCIYEEKISKTEAKIKIAGWVTQVLSSGLTCFNSFLKALNRRMEEITNYFIDRQTSGFVEGLNNKIKVLKRRCYGILNIRHLFRRITLDMKGYSMFA